MFPIVIDIVDPSMGRDAFEWHRNFASGNAHLFPRTWNQFEALADQGRIISARETNGNYVGLAYFIFEDDKWEIGGLMVSERYRGVGLGSTLMRVTLGHLLFEEDPLDRGEAVIAHVHAENNDPRGIIEKALKFALQNSIMVEGAKLPGLKTDEHGIVHGDEFQLTIPNTLHALADWCTAWPGALKNGQTTYIELRLGITLELWAEAFRNMAATHSRHRS